MLKYIDMKISTFLKITQTSVACAGGGPQVLPCHVLN